MENKGIIIITIIIIFVSSDICNLVKERISKEIEFEE